MSQTFYDYQINNDAALTEDAFDAQAEASFERAQKTSESRRAKACLQELVAYVNKDRKLGYSAAKMAKICDNLLYTCYKQTLREKANVFGYLRTMEDVVSDVCVLGMAKKNDFNPDKSNFGTFLNLVFNNYCIDEFNRNVRSVISRTDSLEEPTSDSDDDGEPLTLGDRIGSIDCSLERDNVRAARRTAVAFLLNYANTHLSQDENMILRLRYLDGKSNTELAKELGRDRKGIENSAYRALTNLRKDALDQLNGMLWKKYGYRDLSDLLAAQDNLDDCPVYFSGRSGQTALAA